MESYKSFAVTVQGRHAVCQDASNFYNDENVSIAVVADGHGDPSCFRSDVGSKTAVACARSGIYNFVKDLKEYLSIPNEKTGKIPDPPSHRELEKSIREKLIKQTVASWNMQVMKHYQENPFTEKELEGVSEKYRERYKPEYKGGKHLSHAYGTSLIAVAITPWYWFAYHIGDGRFTVLYEDASGGQPVPWDEKCFLNVTTSICDEDILDRGEKGVRAYLSLHSEKAPPVAFFCCSDGIDDNYPADEKINAECLYRLYREIAVTFAEDGYESTCGQDGRSGQIKDLANGFATKGKGDDTSLAGIVNIPKLKEVAPIWKEKMKADEAEREKAKADEKARIKAEAEARAKAEAEAAARREARRIEAEEKAEAEADAIIAKAEVEAKARIEAEVSSPPIAPPTPLPETKPQTVPPTSPEKAAGESAESKSRAEQIGIRVIDEAVKRLDNQ
jgi:hypothetical protein